jgi:hypothetical protein
VGDGDGVLGSVLVGDLEAQVLAGSKLLQSEDRDLVGTLDLVVVGLVLEPQGKHTLLLPEKGAKSRTSASNPMHQSWGTGNSQVGLVDSSKRLDDDGGSTEESGLEGGVLSRRTLTVVVVTDDDPRLTGLTVSGSDLGNGTVLSSGLVDDLVDVALVGQSTDQHVLGNVLQVSSESQPRSTGRDVVGGTLADDLDEDGSVDNVLSVPSLEGLQELETVRLGVDGDLDGRPVLGRSLVSVLTGIVTLGGELETGGVGELELLAVGTLERVGQGVEGQRTGKRHGGDKVGRGDKGVGGRVGVVTTSEVSVVRGDDRVLVTLLDVLPVPLSDTGSTGVGEDDSADVFEGLDESVTGNGGPDLLGTGGDGELGLGAQTVGLGLGSDGSRSGHVLVRRVGAGSDKTDLELGGPVVVLDGLGELGDGGGEIRGEGTVDVGLELGEVLLPI